MKNKIIWTATLLAVLFASCKKSETTETKPSLTGLSVNSALPYVAKGTVLDFNAVTSKITTSDKENHGTLGIYWQVNSAKKDTLSKDILKSNPTFSYKADTVGTYIVYCYVYDLESKYYNASASTSFTVIDPDTVLEGLTRENEVSLKGSSYPTTVLDGKTWLAVNWYSDPAGSAFLKSDVMESVFGRYYTWEQAQQTCPEGWHLPTAAEFDACAGDDAGSLMVNASFKGADMWNYWPEVSVTNSAKFNAIPVGYTDLNNEGVYNGFKEYSLWWTASEEDGLGCFRYIYEKSPMIQKGKGDKKTLALPVRCVKD